MLKHCTLVLRKIAYVLLVCSAVFQIVRSFPKEHLVIN